MTTRWRGHPGASDGDAIVKASTVVGAVMSAICGAVLGFGAGATLAVAFT